ncbi:MAG TPA: hypothetical protein VFS10_14025 [Pyrinomonadaceae bacterium]|nr:hypothetical protein [Pyrinomonadaceae bacterium]
MKTLQKVLAAGLVVALAAVAAPAQRPRAVETPDEENARTAKPPAPPKVIKAKYMGGYLGYRKKQEGMLAFDERNRRLIFLDKNEREIVSIAYDAVLVTFADTEERRTMGPGTERVLLGTVGVLALPGMLFKKKFEFLTIQYRDPDTDAEGVTQFKLKNRDELDAVTYALAQKAGLVQRGAIFVRKKDDPNATKDTIEKTSGEKQTPTPPE